jgi:hypothetical protein
VNFHRIISSLPIARLMRLGGRERGAMVWGIMIILVAGAWSGLTGRHDNGPAPARASALRPSGLIGKTTQETDRQALRQWLSSPLRPITRDIFSRTDGGENFSPPEGQITTGSEKSLFNLADQTSSRPDGAEVTVRNRPEGKRSLDSVLPQPQVIFNGKPLGVGDVVASFRVARIESRKVVLEREGIELEVRMP